MIPALPAGHLSHLATQATGGAANAASNAANNAPGQQLDATQMKDLIHQQLGMDHHNQLPAGVESFYTMGPDAVAPTVPPVSTSPFMSLDSANLFEDLPRYLNQVGGPCDPMAMLNAQIQVTQAALGWQLMGQMASKASTGISGLFNNQV